MAELLVSEYNERTRSKNNLTSGSHQPTINATLPEEDASQDLYGSAASLIGDSSPPLSPQSPSLLTGYDPVLTQTVVPEQTNRTEKQKNYYETNKFILGTHSYVKENSNYNLATPNASPSFKES
ncbi:Hypothetical predicted protein [Mytilus galloprovincialis]|uniref:Uncharacterized protein n=1 Tax=Mytilus galloprovincialis TaxID=29158 RepID=A0A8B6H0Q9_MYTGA|nr:Hypothetical predicted protein [Mytilus galloprovincialis]